MVVGIIIPDRRDRKDFLNHCIEMIAGQTLQPDHIELVNYTPTSTDFDLTARVRTGFEILKSKGCDCILIMENDDWYSKHYLHCMVDRWKDSGCPDIFGTDYTIYYHLFKREYRTLEHRNRASLMNTLLSCKAKITWPKDNYVFLDLHLWKQLKGKTISPEKPISLGIKHGIGLCGGIGHSTFKFDNIDTDLKFLKANIDQNSFKFYSQILAKKPFKLGIVTACWKRPEVFEMFANATKKLKHPELEIVVIVAGSEGAQSKNMVEKHGFKYCEVPNVPLATKVNASTIIAGNLNCDYILCLGSDDIITNELLAIYVEYIKKGIDYVGVLDWYFYDTLSKRFSYWGGYRDPRRAGHTCGAGRLISSRLMDQWNWQPWEIKHSHVLDNSMQEKLKVTPHTIETFSLKDKGVYAFDIKSGTNMTPFELWDNTAYSNDTQMLNTFFKCVE